MAIGHEHWHEQGEIYALGALDEQELKEFEAHLASGCAICEAYVRETREALLLLHRSITPMISCDRPGSRPQYLPPLPPPTCRA